VKCDKVIRKINKQEVEMGKILAINISDKKGVMKSETPEAMLKEDHGIVGDAHAGPGVRQLSLLANESIDRIRDKLEVGLCFGRFAENITTEGIVLSTLPLGTKLQMGKSAIIEITKIGKECHNECEIKRLAGDCVMPREGIFGKVIKGGEIFKNDEIKLIK
jgi:MOSC domain-containing protein YiiM